MTPTIVFLFLSVVWGKFVRWFGANTFGCLRPSDCSLLLNRHCTATPRKHTTWVSEFCDSTAKILACNYTFFDGQDSIRCIKGELLYINLCAIKEKVKKFHYVCNVKFIKMEDINRIKVVLAEKKRTNKWLAEQLGVNPTTVSKWCTNSSQPNLGTILKIADLLEVDIRELFVREYKSYLISQSSK